MKTHALAVAIVAIAALQPARPAPAEYLLLDHSAEGLIDDATARSMWNEHLPARVRKLYPVSKWGFVSQVMGGFDEHRNCVVTARAMMLPRAPRGLVFKPAQTATAFGMLAGADVEQCRSLAKAKLAEAMAAVESALINT